jgi:ABC-type phosphate transport system auxiliary subunit
VWPEHRHSIEAPVIASACRKCWPKPSSSTELQVQQEELKTANEELEEQLLKESQAHLETQQAELEQTNEQLAERTDALDRKNTS